MTDIRCMEGLARRLGLSVACCLLVATGTAADGLFCLAERGRPASCSIVVPSQATAVQRYAAEELRDFAVHLTGVRLPLVADAATAGRKVVFEDGGQANPAGDGFSLRVEGDVLRVIAAPDRGGSLYAVYEILERFGGCRWYASWCSLVPTGDRLAVPAALDETQVPAFDMRQVFWFDPLAHHDFAARLRMNTHQWRRMEPRYGGEHFRFGGGLGSCHTFDTLVPIGTYGKDHPEYFAFRDGKRRNMPPKDGAAWYAQLCLTNPDVLRLVIDGVLKRIRKDPGARFYGVSQNDNSFYCQCPACAAVDAEEESHAGTVVRFVNAVAEAVEKEFPDAVIETLAYRFSRKPPKKTRLRANVVPCLCSIECDFANPIATSPYKENIAFRDDIRGWRAMTDRLYLWDYTTDFSHYPLPFANVYALQGNIRFFRDNGVRYLFEQGAYEGSHADFAELKAWLLAKWMWNPDLPMKPLLDDFFAGFYGAGASFVREYFESLHRHQLTASADPKRPLNIYVNPDNPALTDTFLEESAALLARADAATKGDAMSNGNVRRVIFSVDYARLERVRSAFKAGKASADAVKRGQSLTSRLCAEVDRQKFIRLAEGPCHHNARLEAWRDFMAQLKKEQEKNGQ